MIMSSCLILHRHKNETLIHLIEALMTEAQRVGLSETELLSLVQSSYQQRKGKGES
ncbi:hypothetical protein CathTA2_0404 [Caldalkalibacillus thermarum TA2.A1]|uniref:Uncharacterized protein n=1 Tax=Caldalkalibacillus thermarum (strain TA2.A1) TaxID=986075 RepID=F5L3P5_CALTT|nr:hypothetical protein [Caldalkalibacillus thermarum]EGL84035.1 hypothetical protein CathTA2_0404 [Caldalkalibacillus thermarum TA2.A1]QZT35212.1 hypothetical protein HUR95_08415 [Caldalkalibacillus thermarum TA2.A1]